MKVRNNKLLDWIGAACGVFLVLVLLGNIVNGAMTAKAEADALKATGIGTVLTAAESSPLKVETAPKLVATGSGIQLLTAEDWAEEYPAIYESYMKNSENTEVQDYVADYPMISTLFEGYGFAKYYGSARGHAYVIEDVTSTGRPHALANCFTCKTPVMTAKAIEMGDAAYSLQFEDVLQEVNEPLSCFNCHANAGSDLVVTHTYLTKALGDDVCWIAYPAPSAEAFETSKNAFAGSGSVAGYAVSAESPNAELAAEVASFISEKYCEAKITLRNNPLVAVNTGLTNDTLPKMMQDLVAAIPSMTSTTAFTWGLTNSTFTNAIGTWTQALVSGEYTVDEFIEGIEGEM